MKYVDWEDDKGYKKRSMLRDRDPDSHADQGVPVGPPDITELDWEGIARDLNNQLFNLGLFNWDDVQRGGGSLTSAILSSVRKRLIVLYRR